MGSSIPYLALENLVEAELESTIYPDFTTTYYWSDNWSPEFYSAQARAGFIATSTKGPKNTWVLLPELQGSYAVLDWPNLKPQRAAERIFTSQAWVAGDFTWGFNPNPRPVIDAINRTYHNSWLSPPYVSLMEKLAGSEAPVAGVTIAAFEIRRRTDGLLVAGEFGYTIGATYTSLSGFFLRDDPAFRGMGFAQLVLLARTLEERGYRFWNLGHPFMDYKVKLGAFILPRSQFLKRWLPATAESCIC